MKLIVFGSTGGIGQEIVVQALEADHEVTAIARRPEAITIRHPHLEVVRGDVLDAATFQQAMVGKDAVISSIGVTNRKPTTLYSSGISNIMQAMMAAHVRRIMCISATGLEPGNWFQHLFAKPILWRLLKEMYTDLVRMETEVKQSSLDWTIVRPPALNNKPRTGVYHAGINMPLKDAWFISRADVASYMLSILSSPETNCATVEIAH